MITPTSKCNLEAQQWLTALLCLTSLSEAVHELGSSPEALTSHLLHACERRLSTQVELYMVPSHEDRMWPQVVCKPLRIDTMLQQMMCVEVYLEVYCRSICLHSLVRVWVCCSANASIALCQPGPHRLEQAQGCHEMWIIGPSCHTPACCAAPKPCAACRSCYCYPLQKVQTASDTFGGHDTGVQIAALQWPGSCYEATLNSVYVARMRLTSLSLS